ncbi:unnamed protein product [Ectocarpus sp. 12 AP-2014]
MSVPPQGMMLSERPSGGSMAPSAGGATALAGAGSIGNYKGVMLCNRPFAGTAAAAKGGGDSGGAAAGKHAFVTGKVKSEVGFAGKSLQTEKLLRKRVKRETALTRHRKWLADLQLTKQALEEQYMEDLQKKEESKRRFAEREARMRQMTRELGAAASDGKIGQGSGNEEQGSKAWAIGLDDDVKPEAATKNHNRPCSAGNADDRLHGEEEGGSSRPDLEEEEDVGSRIDPSELKAVEKRRKRDGKPCRPKWAMTEAEAQVEDELKHEEELEELLQFTQGLDFGRYIKDAEVQSMIDQVKRRILELEGQPEVDEECPEDDDDSSGDRDRGQDDDPLDEAEIRMQAKIMKLTDKNLATLEGASDGTDARNQREEDDNISIARTALSEGGRSVRSIHSTRSLAAVAEKARVSIIRGSAGGGDGTGTAPARLEKGLSSTLSGGGDREMPVNDIVVATHQDDGGLRRGGKNTVSNLPYIRRNPAL